LTLFGIGVSLNIRSDLGLSPWSVLNQGIALIVGIRIGQAGQWCGLLFILIAALMKEPIGLGTVGNMYLVGTITDAMNASAMLPVAETLPLKATYLAVGMLVTVLGGYCYMSAGLGAGPRDSLMVACTKRTKRAQVGTVRMMLEGTAVLLGWALGAKVGVGTLICAFGQGPLTQIVFKLFSFNVRSVKQESLADVYRSLTGARSS